MISLNESISSASQKFVLLGERLGHSWSPVIHNTLFRLASLDAVYITLSCKEHSLMSVLDVVREDFRGANVTIPYKEKVIPFLDEMDETAKACGAVNTIRCCNGWLKGFNTDGPGLMSALEDAGIETHGIHTLILGAGGAARSAAFQILKRGGNVQMISRNSLKARKVQSDFAEHFENIEDSFKVSEELSDATYDLLLNCTPVGMTPDSTHSPADGALLRRCAAVFDAVYNPPKTRLIRMAEEKGLPAVGGFGMLFHQAVEAEKIWLGELYLTAEDLHAVFEELNRRLIVEKETC